MPRYAKKFDKYYADFTDFKAAIRAALPGAPFSGPDSASDVGFAVQFAALEAADLKLITYHYYRGGQREARSTLARLLERDAAFDERLTRLHDSCERHHLRYRINEVNSYSGGGREGVSDTYGSALWALDYLFNLAAHRCAGVTIETDINQLGFVSHYSPIVHDADGVCTARSEYYGLLAFAMTAHGELLTVDVNRSGEVNVTAYATRADGGRTLFQTIVNKDLATDASVECRLPPVWTRAGVQWLGAEGAEANRGVTFAGAAVSNIDGTWQPRDPEPIPVIGGLGRVQVPHASVIVQFDRGD